jgi:hypothetical protein
MIELRPSRPNETRRKRVTPAAVVSVALHTVLLIALWYAFELPNPLGAFRSSGERREERLTYVGVRPSAPSKSAERQAPRDRAIATPPPTAVPLEPPREIPRGIPETPARPPVNLGPTSGPAVGGQGLAKGVQPTYVDPRVWVVAPELETAFKTDEQRMDSAVAALIKTHNDSLLANRYAPNKFERGDWTVDGPGGKFGIDQKFIRLGKFSIPTALLGLLPINGAPTAAAREMSQNPALALHRAEIPYQAERAITHEEFNRAVKKLRERKDRERREREEKTVAKKPIAPSQN